MNVTIRNARPGDAEAMVPLVYSSGPAVFDYVFSHQTRANARDFLYYALQRPAGEFGYRHHIVAELEGEVVGAGTAFSGEEVRRHLIPMLRALIGVYGIREILGIARRGGHAESIIRPPRGRLHYIAHLGVAPDLRGHGIGAQLVAALLEDGRERARETAALDVSVENPRAEALYERLGFRVVEEIPSSYANETAAIPAHRRMEIPIP